MPTVPANIGYAALIVFYNEDYKNKDGSTGAYMIYYCTSSTYDSFGDRLCGFPKY